uniref:Protein FAM81A n=1 Tax=Heterorhabditis bacteriophora TaxID=37862 RepID=A0A1I7WGV7_HETBA
MNTVDRIIYATQNLLSVLEQDDSLLENSYFMQKLIYLRTKHRETLEFLAKVKQDHEEHLQKQVEKAIILNTNEILRAISASIEHKNLSIKFQRMESKSSTHHEEDCWKRRRQYSSGSRLSHFAHFRSKSTHELREFDTNLVLSNDSMDFKREPAQHFTPQVMGTQLLKINVG